MRALVTGAAGFLGRHLVDRLVDHGASVRALIQTPRDQAALPDSVEHVVGDLLDPDSLRQAARGMDTVFHCGAKLPGKADESEIGSVNVEGTRHLLQVCAEAGVDRFVFVSTDSVYGDGHCPGATEEHPTSPEYFLEGNYPRSKLAAERLALMYHEEGKLRASIVRTCLMYGPGLCSGNEILLQWSRSDRHLLIGGGRARFSLAYVTDVADLLILVATRSESIGQCYNVSDGRPRSRRQILEIIAQVTGRRKRMFSIPASLMLAMGYVFCPLLGGWGKKFSSRFDPAMIRFFLNDHVIDIGKAQRELGFEPKVHLHEGLTLLLNDSRAAGHSEQVSQHESSDAIREPAGATKN